MKRRTKAELLAQYAQKPVQRFAQIDLFLNQQGDSYFTPDDEGDVMSAGIDYDLARSECVRVRFPDGTPQADVARALRKILEEIELGEFWMSKQDRPALFGQAEPVEHDLYGGALLSAAATALHEAHQQTLASELAYQQREPFFIDET